MTSTTVSGTIGQAAHREPVRAWLAAARGRGGVRGRAGAVRLARRAVAPGHPAPLLPDLSAVGYLRGPRLGAFTYNIVHNWAAGLGVLGLGLVLGATPVTILGAIVIAHVGMDRAVGYGLKLPSSFHDTHLGRMGREK